MFWLSTEREINDSSSHSYYRYSSTLDIFTTVIYETDIVIPFRLPWWLSGKETTCNGGDAGLIPGSGRSSG